MARKRKKSRAKKKRSEASPAESVEPTEDATTAGDDPGGDEVQAAGGVSGTDVDVADVIDVDTDLDGESIEDLLAAVSGGDVSADVPDEDVDEVDDERAVDDPVVTDDVVTAADIDLGADEPQWLDVPDEPAPLLSSTLTDAADEVVEISLDDDVDEDRERLIAETLAFVGESGDTDAATSVAGSAGAGSPETDDGPDEGDDSPVADHGMDSSPGEGNPAPEGDDLLLSGEYTLPPPTTEAPPRLTQDALLALRGIQTEGIASLPPEVIVDLGDPDSPADRDRLLQMALAQAEMQDAIYRVPGAESQPRNAKPYIIGTILLVAALLVVVPPGFLTPPPPPTITAGDRLRGHQVTLLLQAQQIEAFRSTSGRLPSSLAEVERPLPGVQYVQSNNRLYQLVLRTEDRTLIYDSSSPDPVFEALADRWVTTRGGR